MSCGFLRGSDGQAVPLPLHLDSHSADAQMPNGSLNITPDYEWYTGENDGLLAPCMDGSDALAAPATREIETNIPKSNDIEKTCYLT
jgi:hypothetical protein